MTRVFYGWVIVAAMATVGAVGMALGSLNFGLFIKPMADDLGAGRSVLGFAQSASQVAGALSAPFIGRFVDRFGVRVLLPIAASVAGVAMVGLGFATAGWHVVALFALKDVLGLNSPGGLLQAVPVLKWFVRGRGRALSFLSLGTPVGGLLFVPLTQVLIDAYGWRNAWIILGALGAALIVPLGLIFVRRQPEDLGLLPDGAAPATEVRAAHDDERSWTRAEALRSSTFWRLVVAFSLLTLGISSVALHRIAAFMDRGLDPVLISYATGLDAAAAGVSAFLLGMATRWVPARLLGAAAMLVLAFCTWLTIIAADHPTMFASMIGFGVGIGGIFLIQSYLWAEYFGRGHLGSIRGAVMPLTLVFSAAGAPVAGYVLDVTGSYTPAWIAAIALLVLAALTLALTPPPAGARLAEQPAPPR